MTINVKLIQVTLLFMLFDVLTGTLAAIMHKELSSTVARQGLWHKCSFILLIAFGILLEFAQAAVPEVGLNVPTCTAICTFIIVCVELPSVVENIAKALPDDIAAQIIELFHLDSAKFDYLYNDDEQDMIDGNPYE